mgnify:CR=1 FL=1
MKDIESVVPDVISEEHLRRVFSYVESIQYGTVTLVIQGGKVVQVEKTEKIKLK